MAEEQDQTPKKSDASLGSEQVQEMVDAEQEKGYRGIVPDPTPNANYSAANSTVQNDLPTPETDDDLYKEARLASLGTPRGNVEQTSAQTAQGGKK